MNQKMNCPDKWEAVGKGCLNLQNLLLTDPQILKFHGMLAAETRRLGFVEGTRLLYSLERKARAQTTSELKAFVLGKTGLEQMGIGSAAWAVMRLQCACDFLGQMFPPMSKDDPCAEMRNQWSVERACVWILTELWERRFDSWLKLVAMEWIGPFPFYGIEDAPDWL